MIVYTVWDTEEEDYWETPKGKRVWNTSRDAKNAWNNKHSWSHKAPKFNEQERFVCIACRLVWHDAWEETVDKAWRYEELSK